MLGTIEIDCDDTIVISVVVAIVAIMHHCYGFLRLLLICLKCHAWLVVPTDPADAAIGV